MRKNNYIVIEVEIKNVTSAVGGFELAIKWVLQMDPASIEIQRAKDIQRKAEREASKEAATIERKRAKAKEAAAKATELAKEADEIAVKQKAKAEAAAIAAA